MIWTGHRSFSRNRCRDGSVWPRSSIPFSAVGPADVDEAPKTGMAPRILNGGSGSGGLLTSLGLAGEAPLVRFADSVLDEHLGECVRLEGVHVGLLDWVSLGLSRCVDRALAPRKLLFAC